MRGREVPPGGGRPVGAGASGGAGGRSRRGGPAATVRRVTGVLGSIAVVLGLAACDDEGRRFTVAVQGHLVECVGLDYRLCMLVREPGEAGFSYHYDGIRGFDFEWGRRVRLVVTEREVTPLADGSSIEWTLERVASAESAAGETFELTLTVAEARLETVEPGTTWRFYQSRTFTCPSGLECAELEALLGGAGRVRLELEHPADPADPLIVRGWETVEGAAAAPPW